MSLARHNHSNRISNWFQTLQERKYLKGQEEHGGNLWEKTGMLSHAIEEVIDLAVYLETMEEQLKERFPAAYDFFVSEERAAGRLYQRKMPRIYVAGPYTAEGDWNKHLNIASALTVARAIWLSGGSVLCPHKNTEFMDGPDITWQDFLNGDFEWIAVSDAVFLLPFWEESKGATAERNFALQLNIPVFDKFKDLCFWLEEWHVKQ